MTRRARLALRLAACALAGAVVTVGVALGCRRYGRHFDLTLLNGLWDGNSLRLHWPEVTAAGRKSDESIVVRWSYGVPARALTMEDRHLKWGSGWGVSYTGVRDPLSTRGALPPDVHRYPVEPHWPGFTLDTLFYGSLVFLLWSAPGVIRRRIRKRRGRCPACGYDLRGSPAGTCPECGVQREGLEEREEGPVQTPS